MTEYVCLLATLPCTCRRFLFILLFFCTFKSAAHDDDAFAEWRFKEDRWMDGCEIE